MNVDPRGVVAELETLLTTRYVDAALGERAASVLAERAQAGRYDDARHGKLAEALTRDLRDVTHDLHVRIEFRSEPKPDAGSSPAELAKVHLIDSRRNFGLERVEWLPGNVGLVRIRFFAPPPEGCRVLANAMEFVRDTDALVVDLVDCSGGDPTTIVFFLSYFLDAIPRRLCQIYWREHDRFDEFWSSPYLPTARYGDLRPVQVAIGPATASGAEGAAQILRELDRATLFGERTYGAAHIVGAFPLGGGLLATISIGRAVTLTDEGNWEGSGVAPDVPVAASRAVDVAAAAAIEAHQRPS